MRDSIIQRYLDTYLSVREALGYQMRADRTVLPTLSRLVAHFLA